MARTPLRTTLIVLLVALILLALLIVGISAILALHDYLLGGIDERLRQAASLASKFASAPQSDSGPRLPSDFVMVVMDGTGHVVNTFASPLRQQSGSPDVMSLGGRVHDIAGQLLTVGSAGGDGVDWRVLVVPSQDSPDTVFVAMNLGEVDATVNRLILLYCLVGGLVLVVFAILAWILVRRSLRSLSEVERTAEAIMAGDLSRRVPARHPRTEVGKVSVAVNSMLNRIESAFRERHASEARARSSEERMRRFVADASHELRTPLAAIRGFAELYRQGAADEVPRIMRRIESESTRMGRLVQDLLLLARLDEERELQLGPVDLVDLALDGVHDARVLSPQRTVRIDIDCAGGPAVIRGDEHRVRQILTNLIGNALNHTPDSAAVTVRVRTDGSDFAVLEVADTGPGLSEEDAARLFERFFRADPSRSRASGGSGLGLAIVAALAAAHGGQAEVDTAPGRGATFRIHLPLQRKPFSGLLPDS